MNHNRFLKIFVPIVALPAIIVLFLPAGVWPTYVDVVEPLSLLVGSFLALWVSFSYRKELKTAFIFLSVFLLIYALAIVLFLSYSSILLPYLKAYLGEDDIFSLVQAIQFINYAMLFFFCINILRAVNVTKLNRKGWTLFALTVVFSLVLAIVPEMESFRNVPDIGFAGIANLTRRILDAALIIILAPVLWLYVQHMKAQQRQSLTFTVVIFGIVSSTLLDYQFELVTVLFPGWINPNSNLLATIPEAFFIFGYMITGVGLYAHRKQDEWGYTAIDKAMSGELELVEMSRQE